MASPVHRLQRNERIPEHHLDLRRVRARPPLGRGPAVEKHFSGVGFDDPRLTIPARLFARFDEGRREWVSHPGSYTLHAGRSSRDLRLSARVILR